MHRLQVWYAGGDQEAAPGRGRAWHVRANWPDCHADVGGGERGTATASGQSPRFGK